MPPQFHPAVVRGAARGAALTASRSRLPARGMASSASSGGKAASGATPVEEVPDPPSAGVAMVSMGFGAVGAVAIAAVGVMGAFKMALWAASESGRSMNPASSAPPPEEVTPAEAAAEPSRGELEAELAELRKLPRSASVDAQKAAIKQQLMQPKAAAGS
mmetsp:Transcript_16610/g.42590  ORF Transcript_16610/g.42590 Transcript_16610/m.42590 type:complete len:160 (-) Transcript_16610:75-554(-)